MTNALTNFGIVVCVLELWFDKSLGDAHVMVSDHGTCARKPDRRQWPGPTDCMTGLMEDDAGGSQQEVDPQDNSDQDQSLRNARPLRWLPCGFVHSLCFLPLRCCSRQSHLQQMPPPTRQFAKRATSNWKEAEVCFFAHPWAAASTRQTCCHTHRKLSGAELSSTALRPPSMPL